MIVCKAYLNAITVTTVTTPSGQVQSGSASLAVVCRGEENRDWARLTPAGKLIIPLDGTTDTAPLVSHVTPGPQGRPEFLVTIGDVGEQEWEFVALDFAGMRDPSGCRATFRRDAKVFPHTHGEIELTINAGPATNTLRRLYAASLEAGEVARVGVIARPAGVERNAG